MYNCLRSGLVELIVLVQAQHINNRKCSNSYTINDVCRQKVVLGYCIVQEMRSQFLMLNDMHIFKAVKSKFLYVL
jgi:hypothetical protein